MDLCVQQRSDESLIRRVSVKSLQFGGIERIEPISNGVFYIFITNYSSLDESGLSYPFHSYLVELILGEGPLNCHVRVFWGRTLRLTPGTL
jgi:hypothetical protein